MRKELTTPLLRQPSSLAAPSPYRWAILGIVLGCQLLASAIYLAWPALTPFIRSDFGLTLEQVGFVVGAPAAGSSLASIPFGRLSDRLGARIVITAGLIVTALLAFVMLSIPTFALLIVLIFATGVAYAAINPTGIKVLVPWFPPSELGTAVAIKQVGFPLGGAAAALTLPMLTLLFGSWRAAIALVGVLIGISALGAFAILREGPISRSAVTRPSGKWWEPLRHRDVKLIVLNGFAYAFIQAAWLGHLVLFTQLGLGMPITVAAGFLALSQVSAVVGRIFLGLVSDRIFGGHRRGLLIICGVVAAAVFFVMPLLQSPSPLLVGALVVVFGVSGGSWPSLQLASLASQGGPSSSGTLVGIGMGLNGIGVLLGPPLFGRTVDTLGSYAPAWWGLAIITLVGAALVVATREGKRERSNE